MLKAAIIAAAMPILADADEKGIFHIPGVDDFRWQEIERARTETDWPFTVDSGVLACAYVMGRPIAYFVDLGDEEDDLDNRVAVVSTNPFEIAFSNLGDQGLIDKSKGMEDVIRRLGPFESMGQRLCLQEPGSRQGPREL
jgi:hypothetical protein